MVEALYTILTDADARSEGAVEAKLVETTSAGTPWASEG